MERYQIGILLVKKNICKKEKTLIVKKIILLLSLALFFTSCDVTKSLSGTYNLTQCQYKYNSINGLTLAGVNLQNVTSLSSLNPITAANLIAAFGKSSIPLQFTLNLNIKNPNNQQALLNGLQYIIEIDNVEMTTGSIDSRIQIASGQTTQLPVNIAFDLKKAMSGQSGDAIKNMAFNFVGLGDKPSNVTVRLKPSVDIGGKLIPVPFYIPVSFSYGGKG